MGKKHDLSFQEMFGMINGYPKSQCHCIWVIHLQMGFSCLSHKKASKDNEKS